MDQQFTIIQMEARKSAHMLKAMKMDPPQFILLSKELLKRKHDTVKSCFNLVSYHACAIINLLFERFILKSEHLKFLYDHEMSFESLGFIFIE